VDGAERVKFDKPVTVWVDNFLGFPVGEIVPVGYYDRDRAQWLPMKNGVVVRLLDTDSDGIVDALDADDDGQPDDLDSDGSVRNEVMGLNDNQRYVAGSTFWRAAVTHFSPIDLNWPPGLPPGATPPNPKGQAFADLQKEEGKDSRQCLGSFLEEKAVFSTKTFHSRYGSHAALCEQPCGGVQTGYYHRARQRRYGAGRPGPHCGESRSGGPPL